jgi:hypothetical protein
LRSVPAWGGVKREMDEPPRRKPRRRWARHSGGWASYEHDWGTEETAWHAAEVLIYDTVLPGQLDGGPQVPDSGEAQLLRAVLFTALEDLLCVPLPHWSPYTLAQRERRRQSAAKWVLQQGPAPLVPFELCCLAFGRPVVAMRQQIEALLARQLPYRMPRGAKLLAGVRRAVQESPS